MSQFKALVFDLDDTLLDTSQLLVPMAAKHACQEMIKQGLQCSLQVCEQERAKLANQLSHREIFKKIANDIGCIHTELAIENAVNAFYNPAVPKNLPLMPGALENLSELSKKYSLFLLTTGNLETQLKKIHALNILHFFKEYFIVDAFKGERKLDIFKKIIYSYAYQPSEILSIGNRLSNEIREAKMCGCTTCYFEYGEHVGEKPSLAEDKPDFIIHQHSELISKCNL